MDIEKVEFNKFTLGFSDQHLENEFNQDYYLSSLPILKAATIMAAFLYGIYLILDYVWYEQQFYSLLIIRTTFVSFALMNIIYLYSFCLKAFKTLNIL